MIILTTNLIDCMDEAFESRISYPLHFPKLSLEDKEKIWSDFIDDMDMLQAHKNALLKHIPLWSREDINGRQIRNIIMTAEGIAFSDESHPILTPKHINDQLNAIIEFQDFLRENPSRLNKIKLTEPRISY